MNDKYYLKDEAYMQQHLFEQFSSESHCGFFKDFIIIFIDKNDAEDPKRCKH